MLRRLALGALALTALGLVTASTAAACHDGVTMPPGATGTCAEMGMPGLGTSWMGQMGTGGMMGMGMSGMGSPNYPGAGLGYTYRPITNHPGDLSGIVPCTGCGALFDVCVFGGQCEYMEAGLWPEELGLHPTTNRPSLSAYWPAGPMSCARGRGNQPAVCVDAPGEWNLRAGMPGATGAPGGTGR